LDRKLERPSDIASLVGLGLLIEGETVFAVVLDAAGSAASDLLVVVVGSAIIIIREQYKETTVEGGQKRSKAK
jgi:hypothetical protein